MDRAIALFHGFERISPANWLRVGVVYGCAMTLIAAGRFIPAIHP